MVARATVTQVVLNYDKWYLKVVVTSQTDRASMTDDPNAVGFHHDDRIMAFTVYTMVHQDQLYVDSSRGASRCVELLRRGVEAGAQRPLSSALLVSQEKSILVLCGGRRRTHTRVTALAHCCIQLYSLI